MSKSRKKIVTVRVYEEMYEAVKKNVANSNTPLPEYVYNLIESALEGVARTDLLIRNIHEEVLQLEDMFALRQGFNFEVFATLLACTIRQLNSEEKQELQKQQSKAIVGINQYIEKATGRLTSEDNIWKGMSETYSAERY